MEIYESHDASGTLAIAARAIKSGELILATKPLVCIPIVDNIKSGNYCAGCFAPVTTSAASENQNLSQSTNNKSIDSNSTEKNTNNNALTSVRCPLCTATYCSQQCFDRYCVGVVGDKSISFHASSGECAAIRTVLCARNVLHSLSLSTLAKGAVDHLMMMTVLLAGRAAFAEGLNLPQEELEEETGEERQDHEPSKNNKSNNSVNAKIVQNESTTPATINNKKLENSSKQLSAKEKLELKKKQKEEAAAAAAKSQQQREKTGENDDDDDEEEEESDDEDISSVSLSNNKSKPNNNTGGKKAKDKKKKIVAKAQDRAHQNLAHQKQEAIAASKLIPEKMMTDLKFVESQERTCLAKEFPSICSSKTVKDNNQSYFWFPPFSASTKNAFPSDGNNNNNNPLEYDTFLRHQAILAAPNPSFLPDFTRLISNANLLNKSELSSYETLRRKFNTIVNLAIDNNLFTNLLPKQSNSNNNNSNNNGGRKPFNICKKFFYHVCSAYRCNAFGVFSSKDNQIGLAMYPDASYFNHSCNPNLIRRMDGKAACFYAGRDIGKGEALTICYAGGFKSTLSRRQYLLENYRFFCRCDLCMSDGDETASHAPIASKPKNRQCKDCFAEGYLRDVLVPGEEDKNKTIVAGQECESCFKFTPASTKQSDSS